jgi:6-phosphogluconolactonase
MQAGHGRDELPLGRAIRWDKASNQPNADERELVPTVAMKIEIFADAQTVAEEAARLIAAEARSTTAERGRFVLAVSGGHTPWIMLRALAREDVAWDKVYLAQVDERVAPAGDPDRNLTHLRESLLEHAPLPPEQLYAMPVGLNDLQSAAKEYSKVLEKIAGSPPVFDLVHLGLGPDGHTASLVPDDPVLQVSDADVGVTETYQGRRRMTLTFPVLNRARRVLWLVTGKEKVEMLRRLSKGDPSIPAGRVSQQRALVFADHDATGSDS